MLPNLILTVILLISVTVTTADYLRPQPRETLHFQWSPKPSSYPQQVHISLAGDEYMRVTWVTDDQSSPSIVEYGRSPGRYSSVAQGETLISLILRSYLAERWRASGGGGEGENKCKVVVDWMRRKDLTCVDLSGEILGKF
ncbi:purple acid phosphatase 18-like [Fagus crenata]